MWSQAPVLSISKYATPSKLANIDLYREWEGVEEGADKPDR